MAAVLGEEEAAGGAQAALDVTDLLRRLRECATRDDCDALVFNFCLLANKPARRRMVRLPAGSMCCPNVDKGFQLRRSMEMTAVV